MIQAIIGISSSLLTLGGKMIVDKDKQIEFAFRVQEMTQALAMKLLDTKTYPWIDGLVKLAYASEAIVKGLITPIASVLGFAFALYCEYKGVELSDMAQAVLYGGLPAWRTSRHVEKVKKLEVEKAKAEKGPFWFEEEE